MYIARHYSLREVVLWTRRETLIFLLLAALPPTLMTCGVHVALLPWPPLAVLGTAVAFVTGFKGNAAYGRLWEARQIWGGIVNTSRTFAFQLAEFVDDPDRGERRRFLRRHFAWLTALRYALREPRAWETLRFDYSQEYQREHYVIPERGEPLDTALARYLEPDELTRVLSKKNRANAVLALQSEGLRRLVGEGRLSEFREVELARQLANLVDHQGRSERIKNFPYPRQYATLNLFFIWSFIGLLPFGVLTEVARLGHEFVWLTVPMASMIAWVFHTADKIADVSENPFEGGPNDVPISSIARTIEIDLLDLSDSTELPEPLVARDCVVM